jgi:hypothetical protein
MKERLKGQTTGFIGLPISSLLRDRMLSAMAKGEATWIGQPMRWEPPRMRD